MRELLDEDDFDADTADHTDASDRTVMTPRRALIGAALKTIDTGAVRSALASAVPTVVLITTPTGGWTRALAIEIERSYAKASTITVTERKKDGNDWVVSMMLEKFGGGDHVVICSPDPAGMLSPMILAAADVRLVLPFASAGLLRHAIRTLTGEAARGLKDADVTGLDMTALILALRPGSSAADCVRRLRQLSGSCPAGGRPKGRPNRNRGIPCSRTCRCPTILPHGPMTRSISCVWWPAAPYCPLDCVTPRSRVLRGTGKTLLAGAIARSAGWKLVTTSIADWFTSSDGNLGGVNKACAAFFDALQTGNCVVGSLERPADGVRGGSNAK